jgi:imidazolonepropionase-like amidohydrolase
MLKKILILLALATATLAQTAKNSKTSPSPTMSPTIALRGGKLLTVTHGVVENGVLVMQNGKIIAVGPAASVSIPRDAKVIDVTGMTVYPGLIDSETHLGLTEVSGDQMSNDLVETSEEIMPHMHVYDAFHAETTLIPVARINGVTNAVVAPASQDTLPGQDSFIQLTGRSSEDMLMVRDVAMPLNFTGRQRRNEGPPTTHKFPSTRMGMATQLRQAFLDALRYEQRMAAQSKQKSGDGNDSQEERSEAGDQGEKGRSPSGRDLKLEALLPYLHGQKPVVLAAEEPNDLLTALDLANEFHLKIVLNHLTHSASLLDKVAAAGLPVIVGPIYEQPKEWERYDAVYRLPAEMAKRGIKIAFASYEAHNSRNLPYAAGYAVAFGLPHEEALKALTINAAQIWGVDDRLGSLDAGKLANVVVANGDPLDVKTDVKHVFIDGEEIPMVSKQTELRDQYEK